MGSYKLLVHFSSFTLATLIILLAPPTKGQDVEAGIFPTQGSSTESEDPTTETPRLESTTRKSTRPDNFWLAHGWVYLCVGVACMSIIMVCHICRRRKCFCQIGNEVPHIIRPSPAPPIPEAETDFEGGPPDFSQPTRTIVPIWEHFEPDGSPGGESGVVLTEFQLNRLAALPTRRIYLPTMKPPSEMGELPPPSYDSLYPDPTIPVPQSTSIPEITPTTPSAPTPQSSHDDPSTSPDFLY